MTPKTRKRLAILADVLIVLFVLLPAATFTLVAAGSEGTAIAVLFLLALAAVALQVLVVRYRPTARPSWPTSPRPTAPPAGY